MSLPAEFDVKDANIRYHDWEASQYDDKWSISFDDRCIRYARDRFLKVADDRRYGKVLEIGAGTGFFITNLWQGGFITEAYATDISPGMVEVCRKNAEVAGIDDLDARVADAEALPFPDETFDLVIGHAVIHHLPDVDAAFAEAFRVLKPGGRFVVCGEPTRIGFQLVERFAKRPAAFAMKTLGKRLGIMKTEEAYADDVAALEWHVDLHEFRPSDVRAQLTSAGFTDTIVETEELTSAFFGWATRTIEAMARPDVLTPQWKFFAYRTWMALNALDETLLRRVVPKPFFYNLLFGATKPASPTSFADA